MSSTRVSKAGLETGSGRAAGVRQRQRLIDACISALHIYGPSRTTVEKVVAIADLSPGIVRFYFDSKAAMLVASLQHLADEFEERVMIPVSQLKHSPVRALQLLVELYLDPDIASPRKVSVWYCFWGEASSRQEYYDICGKKDEDFAVLVRELIERLIAETGAAHLDADGIALGLIGVLEILWQGIAFQSEAHIDRDKGKQRSLAYLRSVFPGQFAAAALGGDTPPPGEAAGAAEQGSGGGRAKARGTARLPTSVYSDPQLLAKERDSLFRPAWQVIGHEAQIALAGDFLSADLSGERALVIRDDRGAVRAFRNACRRRPHALVSERRGHLAGAIHCATHDLTYRFDGSLVDGATPGDLTALEVLQRGGLILVRTSGAARAVLPSVWDEFATLKPLDMREVVVAADWKVLIEQWLDDSAAQWRFQPPNQLLEVRAQGALILQVVPAGSGRCRIQCFEFSVPLRQGTAGGPKRRRAGAKTPPAQSSRAAIEQRRRATDSWLKQQAQLAESTQTGLAWSGAALDETGRIPPALAEFRRAIATLLP